MKRDKIMKKVLLIILFSILLSCSSTAPLSMEITNPKDNESIVIVGCLIAENMGIEELFESIEYGTEVVLVGKCIINGIEETEGYSVRTDENGYFFLENVPKGGYVIKGARIFVANSFSVNVISHWRTLEIAYYVPYLQEQLIRHDVTFVPQPPEGKVYNFGITYFGLHPGSPEPGAAGVANTVLYQNFSYLENQELNIGKKYTKSDPITYFKKRFPNSTWFQLLE
ncbi:hypothetical protein ACFL4Z_03905 [candidate division KSB1 bacterium]